MSEQTAHQKVALVTGANKGIGLGAAEQPAGADGEQHENEHRQHPARSVDGCDGLDQGGADYCEQCDNGNDERKKERAAQLRCQRGRAVGDEKSDQQRHQLENDEG